MKKCNIVKNPTQIHGRYLPFGATYGTVAGFDYYVDNYPLTALKRGILNFWVWSPIYQTWMRTSTVLHPKKYAVLRDTVVQFIMTNKLYALKAPTPYVRNFEILENGAPKEKKAQNELVFRVANVGYALSPHIITEQDADRRIRAGVTYFPA